MLALLVSLSSPVLINPIDCAKLIWIEPAKFTMGSDKSDIDRIWAENDWPSAWKEHVKNEQPAHQVSLDGFWMYRNMVTVAQYRAYCKKTKTKMPAAPRWGWKENHPVVNVSWEDAKAYAEWANSRLPYEAEWEYAARGHSKDTFLWGNRMPGSIKPVANLAGEEFKDAKVYTTSFRIFPGYRDSHVFTSPVEAFPSGRFGLRDMAGNAWQWCEDWSSPNYYSVSPFKNPKGPDTGTKKVLRGGAYDTPPEMTRHARRISNFPNVREEEKGFRCVYLGK